eukprot:s617_g18.t1
MNEERGFVGIRATAAEARAKAARLTSLAPELFEQLRPPEAQGNPTQPLEGPSLCPLTAGKSGRRPPPQDAWERDGVAQSTDPGGEALENLRRVSAEVIGKANDLAFRSSKEDSGYSRDPYRWHITLRYPVPQSDAARVELFLSFPATYPSEPPKLELLEPLAGEKDAEALQGKLSVFSTWTSANTVFCLLGELMDVLALFAAHDGKEVEDTSKPRFRMVQGI